jgi:hypothetical protein
MTSATSTKSLCTEEILAETYTGTLCDGRSDVLNVSGDDDNVGNESYGDCGPKTARKIKKTVHHLSTES